MTNNNVVLFPSPRPEPAPAGEVRPVEALDAMVASFQRFGTLIERRALAKTIISGLDAGHIDPGSAQTIRVVLCLIAGAKDHEPL